MKLNCWEQMDCGREPGGRNVDEFGVCPASVEERLDGVHSGGHGGRACWAIAGTFCEGEVQGTHAEKERTCLACEFYKLVRKEEQRGFLRTPEIVKKLG